MDTSSQDGADTERFATAWAASVMERARVDRRGDRAQRRPAPGLRRGDVGTVPGRGRRPPRRERRGRHRRVSTALPRAPMPAPGCWPSSSSTATRALGSRPCGYVVRSWSPTYGRRATRWPGFALLASERGLGAVFSYPLHEGAVCFGVLELYDHQPRQLTAEEMARAAALTRVATQRLLEPHTTGRLGHLEDGVSKSLERAVVYQAQGMVMVDLGVTLAEAMLRMRGTGVLREPQPRRARAPDRRRRRDGGLVARRRRRTPSARRLR